MSVLKNHFVVSDLQIAKTPSTYYYTEEVSILERIMQFTVRPFEGPGKSDYKGAFRVYLSGPALLSLKLRPGDLCQLKLDGSSAKTAIAWNATQKIQDSIVQTSKTLQELYGLKLGDKITIEKVQRPLVVPKQVKLWEVTEGNAALSDDSRAHWEKYLQKELAEIEVCAIPSLDHSLII